MKVVLFGMGSKATAVLKKLIELKEDVVGVVYADMDAHEHPDYMLVENLAKECDIAVLSSQFKDRVGWLKRLNPDVIFVVGWRYKIPKEQYSIPSKGTIVFHDSLLPKYRGFAPMNWAIINGEIKTGATMFYIADEIDSGDILGQAEIPITEYDDAKSVSEKITQAYCGLLETYLPLIKLDRVHRTPQDHTQATYTCKRTPEDGLINWNDTSMRIYNLIRGLTEPYPGAFTYLHLPDGTICKAIIWKACLDTETRNYVGRVAGRVVGIIKGIGVRVLTGYGSIIVEEIRCDNCKKAKADEIITSIKSTFSAIDK